MQLDPYEKREAPTDVSAALTALIRPPDPLPALVQTIPSSDFVLPSPVKGAAGGDRFPATNPARRAGSVSDRSGERTTTPTPLASPALPSAFASNSNPILSGNDLIQDPLGLDQLLVPRSRLPFSGSNEPANLLRPASDDGSSGNSSGPSLPSSSNVTDFSFNAANTLEPSSPLFPSGADLTPSPPSLAGKGAGGLGSTPVSPNAPRPAGPGRQGPHHKDAFYVLDANKAIVLTPGTTDNEFSNTAMDLRMQVSAATVSSYSWDYSGAPDVTGVSGASTYNLTFSWTSFTGAARSETIIAKETPQGGSQVTQTLTFLVAGTNSPAWSTIPTSYSSWPNVITPDTINTLEQRQSMFG